MEAKELRKTALKLLEANKGILAIDESPTSIQKKLDKFNVNNTSENRRRFRNLLIETNGLEKYISGVILHSETFEQRNDQNGLFIDSLKSKGIMPGIKLDLGLTDINYEDVRIKVKKTADEIQGKIPEDVMSSLRTAGTKISEFIKEHSDLVKEKIDTSTDENEKRKEKNKYGEYVKLSSYDNAEEKYREKVSKGLSELDSTLASGKFKKANFAKWRCLFTITERTPTFESIEKNCDILAKYALLCQSHVLVPIVEPEVLFEGEFTFEDHYRIFKYILSFLVHKLNFYNVDLASVIFKIGFVTAGKLKTTVNSELTANLTNDVLLSTIPSKVPGIVFLSGGHTSKDSVDYLAEICKINSKINLSFSYGRALTDNAMKKWNGNDNNVEEARKVLLDDCKKCSEASTQSK